MPMQKIDSIIESNKRVTILNVVISLIYEIVVLIYGLIVPRLIIGTFGSDVNGLVSSISQFLSLITIIEGGVGGVIKAALYKPLAERDDKKLSAVFNAASAFYKKISIIYLIYGFFVAILYPLFFNVRFSWPFTATLIMIIASQTFIQYFFSVNLRALINADRKGFVVSLISIIMQIASLIITVTVLKIYPNILILKGISIAIYIFQPILYGRYVNRHYKIDKNEPHDEIALKQRWDGFGHNLAFFIHSNTDTVLLTIFGTFFEVSVYSVYFMIVFALKTLVSSVSTAITPTIGNILIKGNDEEKNIAFDIYNFVNNTITTFCFTCGIILITPFVMVYTSGVTDVDYFHPWLGVLLMLAEAMYCYRDPYISIAYSSGHFKQTSIYAYIEALMNIVLSIVLYFLLGIEGVALGTFLSMTIRSVAHLIYLKKNLLKRPIKKSIISYLCQLFIILTTMLITYVIKIDVLNYYQWFLYALIVSGIALILSIIFNFIFERRILKITLSFLLKK